MKDGELDWQDIAGDAIPLPPDNPDLDQAYFPIDEPPPPGLSREQEEHD